MKCPLCKGKGTQHLHGAAITIEDFTFDADFAEAYMSGVYEHDCDHCGGTGKTTRGAWEMHQESEAERRMGA